METPKITVNEALIIAKEYHLEAEVTECIKHNINTDYNFCVSETFRLKEQIENLIKIQHYENKKTLYQKV